MVEKAARKQVRYERTDINAVLKKNAGFFSPRTAGKNT